MTLSVEGLNTHYGRAHVLFDVTFEAAPGEVVVLLGRNGAGKSTTLKSIIGFVPASAGTIRYGGRPIQGLQPHAISRLGIGYVPEERRIFSSLTVMENLEVGRRVPREGAPAWTVERLFEIFPNLASMRHRRGAMMSGGEQQMLTIARTLMGNPSLLLLDEPSEGLAPVIVDGIARTILALKREGLTVLLCEQNLRFATAVSDRAYILEKGRVRYHGTIADLKQDEGVRNAYLVT
ncbi:MAG: ABC transporter ATP-binding protein [Alphaproteobacteria bacterium]|nr:ABC transporter ATP-binding protein [Alphaproteobacteria bacterium]